MMIMLGKDGEDDDVDDDDFEEDTKKFQVG